MQEWIDAANALLVVWYPGEEGGDAVADILFGDYNPAGEEKADDAANGKRDEDLLVIYRKSDDLQPLANQKNGDGRCQPQDRPAARHQFKTALRSGDRVHYD